jgi:CheY-like chemotaxis protein
MALGRILVVDDEAPVREVLAEYFTTEGYSVESAGSGAEALTAIRGGRADLVLLDVRMPGMDGVETARRLHAADPGAVVVLVSMGDVPELGATPTPGVAAHVRKQTLSPRTLRNVWDTHGSGHRQG